MTVKTVPGRPLIIYHGNCADGFGGAWVAHKYFKGECDLYAGKYGEPPPDVTNRVVYIIDFSYKLPDMERIAAQATYLVLIDHHKTTVEELKHWEPECPGIIILDMGHSGSMLAWKHFFPLDPPPALLDHIQDRDLWRFRLKGTREIQAALFSYPYHIPTWNRLMLDTDLSTLRSDGVAIERKHFKDIGELLGVTQRWATIDGWLVPIANMPYTLASDACEEMARRHGSPFAACYYDTPKRREFSLRSLPNGIDVSEVARRYGGGGHRGAAGFSVPYSHLVEGDFLRVLTPAEYEQDHGPKSEEK